MTTAIAASTTFDEFKARACYDRFSSHFGAVQDYRRSGSVRHKLVDILFISLCAGVCGADDLAAVAEFTRTNEGWLRSVLQVENGLPCF